MQSKEYSIEFMKKIYKGKYKAVNLQDNNKTLAIVPELEESELVAKINYISNIDVEDGLKKREYYIKKFLADLLCEINVQKIKVDNKNTKIIDYWLKYVEDFHPDEKNEKEIEKDYLYRQLQIKKKIFIDIIKDNNKKELLLSDDEISPRKLGLKSEFTKILMKKMAEDINDKATAAGLAIAVVNDSQGFVKDYLTNKLRNIDSITPLYEFSCENLGGLSDYDNGDVLNNCYNKEFLKEEFLGRFDHIISINSLHQTKDIETFFKCAKLMLKEGGKLHTIDFGKMDPVSILIAIFFQENYIGIETEKRKQFFYNIDYIKNLIRSYFIKSTLISAGGDIAYYFKSESHTNYLKAIKELECNIGCDYDNKIILLSSRYLNLDESFQKKLDNYRNEIIKDDIKNYSEQNEETEDVLEEIWRQNLEINKVERDSNYFKLGGNSLSATKLVIEIEKNLKCKLTLNEIFGNPEFESLLKLIDSKQSNAEIIEGEI